MGILDKPYTGLTDFKARDTQRLQDLGRANTTRSNALANAVFTDSRATQFVEKWADFTTGGWSSTTALLAQNGRAYYNGNTTASGITRAFNYIPGTTRRIVTTVRVNGAGGGVFIGVGEGVAGAAPAVGIGDGRGIYIETGSRTVKKWDVGSSAIVSNTTQFGASDVLGVTMIIDPSWMTITVVSQDGTQEWRARWAVGTFTPNNLLVYNGSLGTGGSAAWVGPLADIPALSTASPRVAIGGQIEGYQRSVYWTTSTFITGGASQTLGLRVALPPNYDARVPSPFVLMWHGHGSNELVWGDNANGKLAANAFAAAGFVVIGFAAPATAPWGANSELDAGYAAYRWAKENLNLGLGAFYLNSMGGIDGMLALAERRIPGISAVICTAPTFSLLANYTNAAGTFYAAINTAYGVTAGTLSASAAAGATTVSSSVSFAAGTGLVIEATGSYELATVASVTGAGPYTLTLTKPLTNAHASGVTITDYQTKTAGHDPALMDPSVFRGLPTLVLSAADDTTVLPTLNANVLVENLAPFTSEMLSKLNLTGGHGFDVAPYTLRTSPYDMVNFAAKYTGL